MIIYIYIYINRLTTSKFLEQVTEFQTIEKSSKYIRQIHVLCLKYDIQNTTYTCLLTFIRDPRGPNFEI